MANPTRTNAGNLKPLSPVFVSCKHRLYLPPNFAPGFIGVFLMLLERLAPIRPVLPFIRQKFFFHKPINQTSTVSAVCIQIGARVTPRQTHLQRLDSHERHPVTPHKTKTLLYTNVVLVPEIRLVPFLRKRRVCIMLSLGSLCLISPLGPNFVACGLVGCWHR